VPEGEVRVVAAGDVELLGAGELTGIVVGGPVVEQDRVAGTDGDAAEVDVGAGVARRADPTGRRGAQDLLDRGRHSDGSAARRSRSAGFVVSSTTPRSMRTTVVS
jgi:hypothetical protein